MEAANRTVSDRRGKSCDQGEKNSKAGPRDPGAWPGCGSASAATLLPSLFQLLLIPATLIVRVPLLVAAIVRPEGGHGSRHYHLILL